MKKIQAALKHDDHVSIPGVLLAFVAGCFTATMCWYFLI
jgi:hypothetical protein